MIKNNNGSILIWSIFFMIFISFSFLYISTVIKKEIDLLSENIFIQEKEELYFEKNFTWILLNLEKKQIELSNTWVIKLISWWPVLINTWTLLTNTWILSPWEYLFSNLGWYSNYTIDVLPDNIKNIEKKYKKVWDFFIFFWYQFNNN